MKLSEVATKLDFDINEIKSISFMGRLYRVIELTGIDDWGNLNITIEMLRSPTQTWIEFKNGNCTNIRPRYLGIDEKRLLNDREYLQELRNNF